MQLEHAQNGRLTQMEELYRAAFPEEERKPFPLLLSLREQGRCDLLAIAGDNGEFLGLTVLLFDGGLALVDYFAVCEGARGQGTGSRVLDLLRERYPDKRIFLEIEQPDPDAENAVQRERRKRFYLRNGCKEANVFARVYGTEMELLQVSGKPVSFSEYCALLRQVLGESVFQQLHPVEMPQPVC